MNTFYHPSRPPLAPVAFVPLPLGSVKPLGWLHNQLSIQARGLSGHIDEFWPDLGPNSAWLGGTGEAWERGPYYLDGLVPLAYLLGEEALIAKAQKWIDWTLDHQGQDGWLGPAQAPQQPAHDVWPLMVMLKALTQYHEATGDARVLEAMIRFAGYLRRHLSGRRLVSWGVYRAQDLVLSLFWLYNRTGEAWLLDAAGQVREQAFDWSGHFASLRYTSKVTEGFDHPTHVVNNAMAVKAPGVWYLLSHDETDRQAVYAALRNLDRYHGTVVGIFTGDEHLAGLDPSQGTELCAVVEFMFSLENLVSFLGDPAFGDRLERIAFNALPATFSPDMWAHQYDQQVNQVLCTRAERNWTNNGPDANLFGLEPNYGCCTANMHQGWPKFASRLWMASAGDGLAAVAYAPSQVSARVRGGVPVTIVEETDYPFGEAIRFRLSLPQSATFPLHLRIPGWAEGAALQVAGEGEPVRVASSTFHVLERAWHDGDQVTLALPLETRISRQYRGSLAVERGPLVFALKMGEQWKQVGGQLPHADWEVYPTAPWNYGLLLDPDDAAGSIPEVTCLPVERPFSPDGAPIELHVRGRRLPGWGLERNSAGLLPTSPVRSGQALEELTLIPYGSTNLRVTLFPQLAE